jgi:RNA polymerase sigma factor (TIGR02999 family)
MPWHRRVAGVRGLFVSSLESAPITDLLRRWRNGDEAASAQLLPMVYAQLRVIARRQLANERGGHTLMPTDLVHEAYLKLSDGVPPDSNDRVHFFAIASRAMRQVLVDHERHRRADKRDGGERITLSSLDPPDPRQSIDLLALDQALDALEKVDERKARVIELRAFGGLDFDEIAIALSISRATLARDFRTARAWLYRALEMPQPDSAG